VRPAFAFVSDLVLLLVFVLIGRASHDENPLPGVLTTLWPFAAGLIIGWIAGRAWRAPLAIVRSGIPIWIATVVFGMLLRAVSGQGVQLSFIIVTTIVLAVFLLGWRAVSVGVQRLRSRGLGD
jgi:hypothetical protein